MYSKAILESYPFCFASLRNSISLSLNQNFSFICELVSTGITGSGIPIGSEEFIGLCVVVIHIPVFCGHCEYCILGAT